MKKKKHIRVRVLEKDVVEKRKEIKEKLEQKREYNKNNWDAETRNHAKYGMMWMNPEFVDFLKTFPKYGLIDPKDARYKFMMYQYRGVVIDDYECLDCGNRFDSFEKYSGHRKVHDGKFKVGQEVQQKENEE